MPAGAREAEWGVGGHDSRRRRAVAAVTVAAVTVAAVAVAARKARSGEVAYLRREVLDEVVLGAVPGSS